MGEIKVGIGICNSSDFVPYVFFESFYRMQKPVNHVLLRAAGYQGVAVMRNNIVSAAKKYNCSHVLFLDVDHEHSPLTIVHLLSHNLPIVSGLNFMRVPPFEPCMFKGIINKYETITEWEEGELIEVDSVGAASLMVKMEVFDKIGSPFFSFMKNPSADVPFDIGEDVYFMNKCKKAGYSIFVDTGLTNKHYGYVGMDQEFYKKYNGIY